MTKYLAVLLCGVLLMAAGCSKDDDDNVPYNGNGILTVNGHDWNAGLYIPNFWEDQYVFTCEKHVVVFEGDLTDAEVGDDVTPSYVLFGTENAIYDPVRGRVIVTGVGKDYVEVKFDNLVVSYAGKFESILGDNRGDDLSDDLKITGQIKFYDSDEL